MSGTGTSQAADSVGAYTTDKLTAALVKAREKGGFAALGSIATTTVLNAALAGMCITGLVAGSAANAVKAPLFPWEQQIPRLVESVLDSIAAVFETFNAGLAQAKDALSSSGTSGPAP
jgi:hypothetical protein